MTPDEWNKLAERCEAAKGLNYHEHHTLTDAILTGCGFDGGFVGDDGSDEWQRHDSNGDSYFSGMITQSLDAITALVERELPGWDWHASTHRGKGVSALNDGSYDWRWITAATPTLALCAAFCRAMAAREGNASA
jgi:hypothetical protein